MKILGIETSCDETAAAIVEDGWQVLSNVVESSVTQHQATGGIVPEVAARDAAKKIIPALDKAMAEAEMTIDEVDAIAVTAGPGLPGSLLVGIETARTLAYIHKKPLVPVHHVTGHLCSNRLHREKPPHFPVIVLTVSGGHNELVLWQSDFSFEILGYSVDDSAGEAFDKGARILGLGFPGGPEISRVAEKGNEKAYKFPRPMEKSGDYNFSFSGLKTALLYKVQELQESGLKITGNVQADLAASFQEAICEVLSTKLFNAFKEFPDTNEIFISGGVSANRRLREMIFLRSEKMQIAFHYPEKLTYCTDNAAMIAGAAYWKMQEFTENQWDWREVRPFFTKDLS